MTFPARTGNPSPSAAARLRLFALPLALMVAGGAFAQAASTGSAPAYPSRPIHMIVPFPPGGGIDAAARPFAEKLAAVLGQPVVIDNRPGAGGNIGAEQAARSAPDGYTIMFCNEFLSTNPNLYKSLRYDSLRDFAPIAKVSSAAVGIAVHPSVPATTLKELIALSQKQNINFATPGVGTGPHLFGEFINLRTGSKFTHIPYKGSAPAISDTLGGQVHIVITTLAPMVQHIQSGKLRGIAVGGDVRSPQVPNVPTLAEAGLNGARYENWYGLVAPAGVPDAVLKRLQQATMQALADPDLQERMRKAGYEPDARPPEALTALIQADMARWAKVVQDANIPRE